MGPGDPAFSLLVPKSPLSESHYSHNYSLLDCYHADAFDLDATDSEQNPDSSVAGTHTSGQTVTAENTRTNSDLTDVANSSTGNVSGLTITLTSIGASSPRSAQSTEAERPHLGPITQKEAKRILKSDYDMYGFKKHSSFFDSTKESYNAWFQQYVPHLERQRKKWELHMKQNGLAGKNAPTRFPPKSDKVKKLVRKGIPAEWRGNAWFFYAGGNERLSSHVGVYDKIVADTAGAKNKDTEVIERDLNRTFPDNVYFNPRAANDSSTQVQSQASSPSPEPGMIRLLRRVLVAFAQYLPHIGYCQSLNFLAGLLLLFMDEERAFWMLVIMTERILPKVHSANLEGVHTDQGVLMMCVREYIPKLWNIIGKSFDGEVVPEDKILNRLPPVTLVTSSWFMSVFVGVLPIESALRVWDIMWYEGSKTIFRISLTICRMCLDQPKFSGREARNAEGESEQIELFQFMQNFPKTITDPSLLVDCCFKKIGGYGYGFLSQDEINKCREFVAHQRSMINGKKNAFVGAGMSELEREALMRSGSADDEIHDVYGFHKSIMSGVMWNKHISTRMRKKVVKRK